MNNNKKINFMGVTHAISKFSHANRLKVGSIIVDQDNKIVGSGYNGTPSGVDNCCEDDNNITLDYVIHAELNAIINSSKKDLSDCSIFVTHSPCIKCASIILQSKIKKVYYDIAYRDESGVNFLKEHNVSVEQINFEN